MTIITCLPPSQPQMDSNATGIFGAPKGRPGRALPAMLPETPISAIAIHCLKDTYDSYLAKMCVSGTKMPVGCHASMHYVLDGETGRLTSLVPETDIAWAFQEYRTNFPVTTPRNCCLCPPPCPTPPCPAEQCEAEEYVGWPVLSAAFPNLSADFYAISIGITLPSRPETSSLDACNTDCIGPFGLSTIAYAKLVQLIAWIEYRYAAITIDAEHIAFHDDIVLVEEGCKECACDDDGACLLCSVSDYCEKCKYPGDPTIATTVADIAFVYGLSGAGCRVKIALCDLALALATCEPAPASIGGLVFYTLNPGDCIEEVGVTPLAAYTVNLYTSDGNLILGPGDVLIDTTLTDIDGRYLFEGLAAGDYWVEVIPQLLALCSDAEVLVDELIAGEAILDINFGFTDGT